MFSFLRSFQNTIILDTEETLRSSVSYVFPGKKKEQNHKASLHVAYIDLILVEMLTTDG